MSKEWSSANGRALARKMRRRQATIGLAIALLVLGFAWLEREPVLRHLAGWWVISDDLTHADAIVVLGGSIDVRPFAAADLYKRGYADKVLVSNVQLGRAERLGFVRSHTQLNCDVLVKLGVPAEAIVAIGENVSSTREEAQAVRAWASEARAKAILVPTELFTARRTGWIFKRELDPIGVRVIVHAYPPPDYTLADWWESRYGLIDFNNEVLKYFYYRARY
jgi:uncharacterized SAM-binding protein YcdF (DUF218 family)